MRQFIVLMSDTDVASNIRIDTLWDSRDEHSLYYIGIDGAQRAAKLTGRPDLDEIPK